MSAVQFTWRATRGCSNKAKCASITPSKSGHKQSSAICIINKLQWWYCNDKHLWCESQTGRHSNTVRCATIPKVGPSSQVMDHPRWLKMAPLNFWGRGFLLVFNSNYIPTVHQLATIDERDQPTSNQPTTSWHRVSQYVPVTNVTEVYKTDSYMWYITNSNKVVFWPFFWNNPGKPAPERLDILDFHVVLLSLSLCDDLVKTNGWNACRQYYRNGTLKVSRQ